VEEVAEEGQEVKEERLHPREKVLAAVLVADVKSIFSR
jgi:hypothetical protein